MDPLRRIRKALWQVRHDRRVALRQEATTGVQRNEGGLELPVFHQDEPLVGYRLWRVRQSSADQRLRLFSINWGYIWDVENKAQCLGLKIVPPNSLWAGQVSDPCDFSPSLDHACGLYAQLPEHPLSEWHHGSITKVVRASGTVALSGQIIECDAGYKAEYATIQSPVVLETPYCREPKCRKEAEWIGVDRTTTVPVPHMVGYCDSHRFLPKNDGRASSQPVQFWMAGAIVQLEAAYPGIEFLSWHTM